MKYRSIATEQRIIVLNGRAKTVEPGEVVEFPDGYPYTLQTIDVTPTPLWESVAGASEELSEEPHAKKATSSKGSK